MAELPADLAVASIASSPPESYHLELITAAAQADEARVRKILAENTAATTNWATQNDRDALRQALQKVAARGHLPIVQLLLAHGAEVEARRSNEIPALYRAAETGHAAVVAELLGRGGANPNAPVRARLDQTALFAACARGHDAIVAALLTAGADPRSRDRLGRTPLLLLAAEKVAVPSGRWAAVAAMLQLLLAHDPAGIEVRDSTGRTALLWAATNGNVALVAALLDGSLSPARPADVAAANNRGRAALHLAAAGNHTAMVRLLLRHGAQPSAASDGGWTALHNAAQGGFDGVAALLLEAGADVNAELSNGMTPLHWAAFNGHAATVRLLLAQPAVRPDAKDTSARTPMLCAAESGHGAIVRLLSPVHAAHRLSPAARAACESFRATVVDFGAFSDGSHRQVFRPSVYDVLYGWDDAAKKPKVETQTKNIKYRPSFRWIHLPANNIAWAETLLAKWFIESGHRDIESFKALEKCFDQEHRGPLAHAHFMRTFCHRIASQRPHAPADDNKAAASVPPLPDEATATSTSSADTSATIVVPQTTAGHAGAGADTAKGVSTPKGASTPKKAAADMAESGGGGGGTKRKGKAEALAERHPRRAKRSNGPPGNPPGTKALRAAARSGGGPAPFVWDGAKLPSRDGKIVSFMPFLHYETDECRQRMSHTIDLVRQGWEPPAGSPPDVLLIKGYLQNTPPLHPRRTLDQFFYHGIDTSIRDTDQVVYRYCKRHNIEKKVFMVDQMWLWVLSKDLIVTCCPKRWGWDWVHGDPIDVVDGIIEETNADTRPSVLSVYDLAMVINSRCSIMFDRYRLAQNLQFLDMFESSIGLVTNAESELFSRFNKASELSAEWLELHRHPGRRRMAAPGMAAPGSSTLSPSTASSSVIATSPLHVTAPVFPDALLDIGTETSLLAEIKDIRDELNIIAGVLSSQVATIDELEGHLVGELQPEGTSRWATSSYSNGVTTGAGGGAAAAAAGMGTRVVQEIRKRARDQRRLLEGHHKDIERMDRQAESIYLSLTHLLDLKQKHSNALEARFARDHAMIAARQGQTIMTFTIVTILFLPMSFIAAFFSIQISDWERDLTVGYVSKYLFGIGLGISIPLILMAFTVNDILDAVRDVYATVTSHGALWNRHVTGRHRAGGAAVSALTVAETAKHAPPDTDTDSLATLERVKKSLLMGTSGLGTVRFRSGADGTSGFGTSGFDTSGFGIAGFRDGTSGTGGRFPHGETHSVSTGAAAAGGGTGAGSHARYASTDDGHGVVLHQQPTHSTHQNQTQLLRPPMAAPRDGGGDGPNFGGMSVLPARGDGGWTSGSDRMRDEEMGTIPGPARLD